MKTKLITALRKSANVLEDGSFPYYWGVSDRCNCGIVACTILGSTPRELFLLRIADNISGSWSGMAERHCPVTGMPTSKIFGELVSAGMKRSNFAELEHLSNETVWRRAGFTRWPDKADKFSVIRYLRAWASLLEEADQRESMTTLALVNTAQS